MAVTTVHAMTANKFRRKRQISEAHRLIYHPLNQADKQIRVLHVHSVPKGSQRVPECTLETVSLLQDPEPQYEAISYCWSELNGTAPIVINGVLTEAPASAVTVLRRFRDQGETRPFWKKSTSLSPSHVLWIDAICIDQIDLAERSQQVAIMGDIFRNAQRTLVWLGEEDESTSSALDSLRLIVGDMEAQTGLDERRIYQTTIGQERQYSSSALPETCDKRAVGKLFGRRWFQRLWVMQEVVLARSVVCYCGFHVLPWSDIRYSAIWIHYKSVASQWAFTPTAWTGMSLAYDSWRVLLSKSSAFGFLLMNGRNLLVTDPKDKVYAILGLAQSLGGVDSPCSKLAVDYSKPLATIYREATMAVMLGRGNCGLLRYVEQVEESGDHIDGEDLPSWVPRWDERFSNHRNAYFPQERYYADAGYSWNNDLNPHNTSTGILLLEGLLVDSVCSVSESMRYDRFRGVEATLSVAGHIWDFVQRSGTTPSARSSKDIALTITAFGLQGSEENGWYLELLTEHFEGHEPESKAQHRAPNTATCSDTVRQIAEDIKRTCKNRRAFVTTSGRIGLGPRTMKEGDNIAILFGACEPYVLRQQEEGKHRLVGHCYVHGIMNGEAVHEHEASGKPTTIFKLI